MIYIQLAGFAYNFLVFKNQEDLLATSFVVTPCDVIGLLEIRIGELSAVFGDGLDEVELQWVLVTILDLQFWPRHVDVDPGLFPVLLELVDDLPVDHGPNS